MKKYISDIVFKISGIVFFIFLSLSNMEVFSQNSLSNGNKLKFDLNNDGSITFTITQLNEWEVILLQ
jgi:hypothetical protein